MIRMVARNSPSTLWVYLSPLVALLVTALIGAIIFAALGKNPVEGLLAFFWHPVGSAYALGELTIKVTPLLLIALGLVLCYRSNVWNIGAEGQFVMGAVFAGGVALMATKDSGAWIIPLVLFAGAVGGALWAALCALLRDRFNANEILVSLMLVYIAILILSYLVHGPWIDPNGYNFPKSRSFEASVLLPRLMQGSRMNLGLIVALVATLGMWIYLNRTRAGYAQTVAGLAPNAARYAGFSARRSLWSALVVGGALAGLAGAIEVIGPVGQLNPYIPVGYGFAAIIVAFIGRLQPAAAVLGAVLMSMFYIGGEIAQSRLGVPKSVSGVFQGVLLFCLLVCDTLILYRIQRVHSPHGAP